MKKAVIFGAGNIGRGFIGQLFSESGYQITYVDLDQPLLDTFNRNHHYTIRLVTNETSHELKVGPVRGVSANHQPEAVLEAIVTANLGATAVGVRALEQVALTIAAGIQHRADQKIMSPLNIILCENLKNAALIFSKMVKSALPAEYHIYLAKYIGFVDTVIARMIPPLPVELRNQDRSLILAEPYKDLPIDANAFIGPIPDVVGLIPATAFSFYTEQKLYIHNAGHAVLGYIGYQHGYKYAYKALLDPQIFDIVHGAMVESQRTLEKKYNLAADNLTPYIEDLLARFGNVALGDTIFRLGRDPIRKLARHDRLIGAALAALSEGIEPKYLLAGIVAALHFNPPHDPLALELQNDLLQDGLEAVLHRVGDLKPTSPLAQMIQQEINNLSITPFWEIYG